MSTTTFIEATSADPVIRELHRKAVRLLNDPSLDRRQREFHVRRLQSVLMEHQAKQAAKTARLAAKKAAREQVSRENRNQGVADPSQVLARRREFGKVVVQADAQGALPTATQVVAANDNQTTGHRRPVLTLKRA